MYPGKKNWPTSITFVLFFSFHLRNLLGTDSVLVVKIRQTRKAATKPWWQLRRSGGGGGGGGSDGGACSVLCIDSHDNGQCLFCFLPS
jgi:hypothetical protein